jgi:lipid-A-disaccharide synthase
MIARRVVNVPFISLVNLIMEREVVKEFIQGEMNADTLTVELKRMLDDENYRSVMRKDLDSLREKLGGTGASERVALQVLKSIGR